LQWIESRTVPAMTLPLVAAAVSGAIVAIGSGTDVANRDLLRISNLNTEGSVVDSLVERQRYGL